MRRTITSFLILSFAGMSTSGWAVDRDRTPSRLIEEVRFDWDHSGLPTIFALYYREADGLGDANQLVITRPNAAPWRLSNRGDLWAPLRDELQPTLLNRNLIRSKHLLFLEAVS